MTVAMLTLDAAQACAVALRLLARDYRRNGLPVPAIVRATGADLDRLLATELAAAAPVPEPALVARTAVTIPEAADTIGVSTRTIERAIAAGDLAAVTLGTRTRRILTADLDQYLTNRRNTHARQD